MINSGELDYSSGAEARTALLEVGMSIGLPTPSAGSIETP
jgi:hypothetical protein